MINRKKTENNTHTGRIPIIIGSRTYYMDKAEHERQQKFFRMKENNFPPKNHKI